MTSSDEQRNTHRNFRSSYYGKVGQWTLPSVDNSLLKKMLEENFRDYKKLKQFCLIFTVPAQSRAFLFQLILGILPLYKDNTEFVQDQRKQIYADLLRAVQVLQNLDLKSTPKNQIMLDMWKIENNRLMHRHAEHKNDDLNFEEVVKVFLKTFNDDCEVYWISKEFYSICLKEVQNHLPKLNAMTKDLLQRDDATLYKHLETLGVFENDSLLNKWYTTCFAGVIEESFLIKVWDRICGGSKFILVFVFLELVIMFRKAIFNCKSLNDIEDFVKEIKKQDNAWVHKATGYWYNSKSHNEIAAH